MLRYQYIVDLVVIYRRMQVTADLNNMSWRVRPEEVLLEAGKPFSSRLGLQKNEVRKA